MLPQVLLVLCLIVGGYLVLRGMGKTDLRFVLRVVLVVAVGAAAVWFVFLALTGRLGTLFALAPLLIPLAFRWRSLAARFRGLFGGGGAGGRVSRVETAWLRVWLDHDSGAMGGEVRQGRFAGAPLDQLDRTQLLALHADVRTADPQSTAVLEAYLDRTLGDGWRGEGQGQGDGPGGGGPREEPRRSSSSGAMTRDEAYEILGLAKGASDAEIRDAHRRLMLKMHPDQGGSNYLAAKINQAKDLLLGD
jgi:hypothetical protein